MSDIRHVVYDEFVGRLLLLESVDAIRRALMSDPNIDTELLYLSFASLEESYRKDVQPAQYELLRFVRTIVDDVFKPGAQPHDDPVPIATPEELIDRVLHTTNLLHAYRLLQKHRSLITEQLHSDLMLQ